MELLREVLCNVSINALVINAFSALRENQWLFRYILLGYDGSLL